MESRVLAGAGLATESSFTGGGPPGFHPVDNEGRHTPPLWRALDGGQDAPVADSRNLQHQRVSGRHLYDTGRSQSRPLYRKPTAIHDMPGCCLQARTLMGVTWYHSRTTVWCAVNCR